MRKLIPSLTIVALVCLSITFLLPARAESLGIGVTIIPDPANPTLNSNSNLWFGGETGTQMQRKIVISSASAIDQLISFQLLDLAIVDGEEFVDSQSPSDKADWLIAEPSVVLLEAGESEEVTLTLSIPDDAEDSASIVFLRIQASDAAGFDPNSEDSGTGTKAVLAGAAAVDIETWIGVGDALLLIPKFEFLVPQGIIRDGKKYIRAGFQNRGLVPLLVTGQLTLNDQTFAGRTFGPFEYQASGIAEDEQGTFEVEVPDEVQEGPWQIYLTARMGNVRENRLFTLNLTFVEENSFQVIWLLYLLVVLVLSFVLVVGIRLIRSGKAERRAETAVEVESNEVDSFVTSDQIGDSELATEALGRDTRSEKKRRSTRKIEVRKTSSSPPKEYEVQLDDWAEELRKSLREIRADSQTLIEKYQDTALREPGTSPQMTNSSKTKVKSHKPVTKQSPSGKSTTTKKSTAKPKPGPKTTKSKTPKGKK